MAKNLPKHERVEKQATAWALRTKGWTETRIAAQLEIDQSTVSRWLKAIAARVLRDLDDEARTELVVLLGQLHHVADEALQAWERSKKPKKRGSQRTGGKDGKPGATSTTEVIERDGDPAHLQTYHATFDRIVKLLALEDRFRPKSADDEERGLTLAAALAAAEQVDADYQPDDEPAAEQEQETPS